jgi:hypothetical protein
MVVVFMVASMRLAPARVVGQEIDPLPRRSSEGRR